MVNTDGGTGFSGGLTLSGSIEWTDVKPGMVVMGSANRSILFGGIGPRHEVSIGYRFKISRIPVPSSEALKIIQTSEADIASESEWELANSRGLLSAEIGCIERLEDRHHGYWERFATADLTTSRIEVCKILDIGRRADQCQSNAQLFLRLKKPNLFAW